MIEILTLLYGLLLGPVEVELAVPPETAQIEVRFDDQVLVRHSEAPWQVMVPFPEQPRPGRLRINALDDKGELLATTDRLINLDFETCVGAPAAATPFIIEIPASAGPLTPSELAGWFQVAGQELEVLELTEPPARVLVVQEPEAQDVFDRLTLHFLRSLGGGESITTERALERGDQELLTIAADFLDSPMGDDSPAGEPSRSALAMESAQPTPSRPTQFKLQHALRTWQKALELKTEGTLQMVWPNGPPVAHLDHESLIHPMVGPFDARESGWLWHLRDALKHQKPERVADAVAVAGLEAAASCGRRAVLLLESAFSARDSSLLEASTVRDYLQALQVPFVVLRDLERRPRNADKRDLDRWGPAFYVQAGAKPLKRPKIDGLVAFHHRVASLLQRQRVVWLRGEFSPTEIDFEPHRPGFRRAGGRRSGDPAAGDPAVEETDRD